MFEHVSAKVDFVQMERDVMKWWEEQDILEKYLHANDDSPRTFSFIDGPITANNPMGVHHAWGRTYKDVFQRYKTMRGFKQRYQNGFDGQGLWIEVEVEKELKLNDKREIEDFGIDRFVELCKERVRKFAAKQTEQSVRLGYWMQWDNSYHTMSDENNYTIWHFLKVCHERGWVYEGTDVMPWCPRCGTGLSEHEIVTEGYQEIVHPGLYVKVPADRPRQRGPTGVDDHALDACRQHGGLRPPGANLRQGAHRERRSAVPAQVAAVRAEGRPRGAGGDAGRRARGAPVQGAVR